MTRIKFLNSNDFLTGVPVQLDKNPRWISWSKSLRDTLFKPRGCQIVLLLVIIISIKWLPEHSKILAYIYFSVTQTLSLKLTLVIVRKEGQLEQANTGLHLVKTRLP